MIALAEPISFHWIDAVGLVLLAVFGFLGSRRGLWWQTVRLLGASATVAVARALAPRAAPAMMDMFTGLDASVADGLVWVFIVSVGFFVVALVGRIGREQIEAAELTSVDRVGGALLGLATGVVVFAGVMIGVALVAGQPFADKHIVGTTSERVLTSLADTVPGLLDVHAAETLSNH